MDKDELIRQAIENRYNHLKLVYGEHDPYMAGFRDCMNIFERKMRGNEIQIDTELAKQEFEMSFLR